MLESVLIPLSICVLLPIVIVSIICYTRINSDNQRAKVLIKAIEANNNIDADKLAESLRTAKVKSPRDILNLRLLNGTIFTLIGTGTILNGIFWTITPLQVICYLAAVVTLAIGIGNLVVYFVTRKQSE